MLEAQDIALLSKQFEKYAEFIVNRTLEECNLLPKAISFDEVRTRVGHVSKATLERDIENGILPMLPKKGKTSPRQFLRSDVDKYIMQHDLIIKKKL